jgi:predicted dehydrogenase
LSRSRSRIARWPPPSNNAFAKSHGIALVDGYAAALADPKVDAIVLATPNTQHAEQVIAATRAGKHVFTEKL